uniref:Uncharacterized protein n=1 Tax=Trypanosoma vivax (strain Y486) TaxID=1055687 RepID=G0U635_TRYVY|nr:hypothetical protein TVY486_1003900 [Trypanosoma vivax Y486]
MWTFRTCVTFSVWLRSWCVMTISLLLVAVLPLSLSSSFKTRWKLQRPYTLPGSLRRRAHTYSLSARPSLAWLWFLPLPHLQRVTIGALPRTAPHRSPPLPTAFPLPDSHHCTPSCILLFVYRSPEGRVVSEVFIQGIGEGRHCDSAP